MGCCSLRVEHIRLHDSLAIDNEEKHYVVEFDFLGKDSIRYFNRVPVEKRVYKNLKIFMRDKQPSDELFDRLTVCSSRSILSLFTEVSEWNSHAFGGARIETSCVHMFSDAEDE